MNLPGGFVILAGFLLGAAVWVPQSVSGASPQIPPATDRAEQPLKAALNRDDLASTLERLIPKLMKDGDVPGVSVAVVRDGQVLWHRAFGVKDASKSAPIDDETIFEAASLSKP